MNNRILTPQEFSRRGAVMALKLAKKHGLKDPDGFAAMCLGAFGFSKTAAQKAVRGAKRRRRK